MRETYNIAIKNNQDQLPEISFYVATFEAKITEPITIKHDPIEKGQKMWSQRGQFHQRLMCSFYSSTSQKPGSIL